jgi:hypothetical protein
LFSPPQPATTTSLTPQMHDNTPTTCCSRCGPDYTAYSPSACRTPPAQCVCAAAAAGFPTTCLEEFPVLKEYRNRIASIDFVQKHYADVTEGMLLAFQPEP